MMDHGLQWSCALGIGGGEARFAALDEDLRPLHLSNAPEPANKVSHSPDCTPVAAIAERSGVNHAS